MSGSRTYRKARKGVGRNRKDAKPRKGKNRHQREKQTVLDNAAELKKEEAGMIRQARVRVEKLRIAHALRDL